MAGRSHYLPRASVLDKLSVFDQVAVLDYHARQIEDEIAGIESGYYIVNHKGKAHNLRLAKARMRRLVKLAQSYGYWSDEKEASVPTPLSNVVRFIQSGEGVHDLYRDDGRQSPGRVHRHNIEMPALSPAITEGVITKWLVSVGDFVVPGMVIVEIETEKATIEYEVSIAGRISEILIPAGSEQIAVGTPIAAFETSQLLALCAGMMAQTKPTRH